MNKVSNLWDRQHNKRALDKKERAKNKTATDVFRNSAGLKGFVCSIKGDDCVVVIEDGAVSATSPSENRNVLSIGDFVLLRSTINGFEVDSMLPRKSCISRLRGDSTRSTNLLNRHVLAANIDVAVIVTSVAQPEFHQRFVDRCLIICQAGHVKPIVCLNKSDLIIDRPMILDYYKSIGIPVVETSTVNNFGIETLKDLLRSKKSVFFGQSGVGKSSLLNTISPELKLRTGAVSDKTKRGHHTTTASNAYEWEKDSYVIDTPGIRSIGVEDIPLVELRNYFPEFDGFRCKYTNCTHTHEPGCAVKEAVDEGFINHERYESYVRLAT